FQEVKLRYGHEAEDLVLKEIAALCTKTVRAYDILGRYRDEEFALLLPETDLPGALSVVERLRRSISQTKIPFRSSHLKVTASFGIVPSNPGADEDLESLLLRAERAVLQAKEEDLGKVVSLLPTGTAEPVV
ncbi:MAG TPA: GGDEF domain-containing protein, partial [Candidatus Aminicenantes bacterium]|nr:GGDEF domain-containing protein [Candidatus Aminicenantes bacterium]